MKLCAFSKKAVSFLAAGLLTVTCVQPMNLMAEDEPVPSATAVAEEVSDPTPSPSAAPVATETPAPEVAETNALARAADTTAPIIKSIELVENGKTLKNGDTITVNVRATDADSGVNTIYVSFTRESVSAFGFYLTASEGDPELFTGTYTLNDCLASTYNLGFVKVGDNAGNSANGTVAQLNEDNTYTYLYTFDVEDDTVINVTDIHDGLSDEVVERGYFSYENGSDFTVTIDQNIGQYQTIYAVFTSEETSSTVTVALRNDSEGNTFRMDYLTNLPYVTEEKIDTYTLSKIYMSAEGGTRELVIEQDISTIDFQLKLLPYESTEYSVTSTGAEFARNGEIVHAGDALEFIISADGDGVENSYANVTITPAVNLWGIDEISYTVDAPYDSARKGYVGTWTVTENTYPCEWYISYAYFYPVDGGEMIGSYSDYRYPAYVNVQKDGTFTEETHDLHISVSAYNSDGYTTTIMTSEVEDVPRRYTLRELGITLPEMTSPMEGMNQTGWMDSNGREITEDTELLNTSYQVNVDFNYLTIYASYDKVVASGSYWYIADDGKYCYDDHIELFDAGTTYGQAIKSMSQHVQDDMTTAYTFTGWDFNDSYINQDDVLSRIYTTNLSFFATYAEGLMVGIYKEYVDENGFNSIMTETAPGVSGKIVAEGTTYQELYDEAIAEPMPALYPGLRFKGWNYNDYQYELTDVVINGSTIRISADYENSIVRYIVDERFDNTGMMEFEDAAYFECKLVEAGDDVVIPVTVPGFESVRWLVAAGELPITFKAEAGRDYAFYGIPGNSTDTPVDPADPEETPDPVRPTDNLISQTVANINNAEAGGTVVMDMGNANTVPSQVLEAAKGKEVNIVLNMGGYTWTINGKNIYADHPTDINLKVIFNTDAVPSETVKKLAGDNDAMQLQLVHSGDFGFKATLTFNAGADKAGQYGNLYYYNSEGRMIFNNAGKIAENGSLSLSFSHASDYVVVFADHDMSVNNNPTGVWNSPVPYAVTIMVCAIGALFIRKRQTAK